MGRPVAPGCSAAAAAARTGYELGGCTPTTGCDLTHSYRRLQKQFNHQAEPEIGAVERAPLLQSSGNRAPQPRFHVSDRFELQRGFSDLLALSSVLSLRMSHLLELW